MIFLGETKRKRATTTTNRVYIFVLHFATKLKIFKRTFENDISFKRARRELKKYKNINFNLMHFSHNQSGNFMTGLPNYL